MTGPKTGWLSPDGELVEAATYDHIAVAQQLVDKFGYASMDPQIHNVLSADEILLNRGWAHITITHFMGTKLRISWKNYLTTWQKQFLKPFFENTELPVAKLDRVRWEAETNG